MGQNARYKKPFLRDPVNRASTKEGLYDPALYSDAFGDELGQEIFLNEADLEEYKNNVLFREKVDQTTKKRNDLRNSLLDDRQKSFAGNAARDNRTTTSPVDKASKPVISEETLGQLLGTDEKDLLGL